MTPLDGKTPQMGVDRIENYHPKPNEHPWANANFVSSDYFRVLGIHLIRGRDFNSSDNAKSPRVAIVDESFVQSYRGGDLSVGWHIYFPPQNPSEKPEPVEVIGIVRTIRGISLAESPGRTIYCPNAQQSWQALTLAVQTGLEPSSTVDSIHRLVKALDVSVPIFQVRTIEQQVSSSLGYQRLATTLLNGFSVLALLLVALGLYGVLAFSVGSRTREIGLRLALGAQITDIFRLVIRQGAILVVAGLVLGLGGAVAGTSVLRSQLYGVDALDPVVFGAVALLLIAVAALACWLPARRATKVDPMVALRAE
jgi:putative ABC transport system permease protein